MPQLTIITINYNSSENTIKLLESLKNQTDKNFKILLVDNASVKTDFENLNTYYNTYFYHTKGTFIRNGQNLGYSEGNNVGIKKALENEADWVVLLNNDTWVESTFIERLRAVLEGKEGIMGLALNEGERNAYAGLIQWLKPTLIHITTSQVVIDKTVDKLYAIGGAMLIHRSAFDKIGFLDENYFLYFEDADFCLRARKAGIPVSFLDKIKIHHSVSASTKKLGSPLLLRYHCRNALYFNVKNGPRCIKILVWPWSWWIALKQIVKIAVNKNRGESKAILKGVGDFYRKRYGKIPNY